MTDLQLTLDFLRELAQHNARPWFEAHRADYEKAAGAFEALVADVIADLSKREDLGAVTPKDCMFRIYRDVRFSKDKSPYKTQMGAAIGRGGRRTQDLAIYVHIEPGGTFVANGLYEPDKTQLERVRRRIVEDADSLRAILRAPDFERWFGALDGDQLKTAPQGYDREHPAMDLLRYKQFLATHRLSDADVVSRDLLDRITGAYDAMQPFMRWMRAALEPG